MKNLFRQLPYYRHCGKVSFSRSPHDPTLCLINLLKALRSIARYRCPMRPMCPGCFYSSQISNIENSVQGEKVGHPRHVGHVTECYRADQSGDLSNRNWPASGMSLGPTAHVRVRPLLGTSEPVGKPFGVLRDLFRSEGSPRQTTLLRRDGYTTTDNRT